MAMFALEMDYPPQKDNSSEAKSVQLNELTRRIKLERLLVEITTLSFSHNDDFPTNKGSETDDPSLERKRPIMYCINVDENCKCKTDERVFENAWEYSRHFATPPLVSQGNKVWGTSIETPYRWPDLGSASDWLKQIFNQSDALPRSR